MIVKMLKQLRCEWVIIKTRPIMTGWSDASVLEWVMQPRVWCRTTEYRRQQLILSSDWSTLSRDQETPAPGSHLLISSLSSVFSLSLQANSSSTKSCSVSTLFTCVCDLRTWISSLLTSLPPSPPAPAPVNITRCSVITFSQTTTNTTLSVISSMIIHRMSE